MEKIKEFESLKICKNLPVTRHTAMKNQYVKNRRYILKPWKMKGDADSHGAVRFIFKNLWIRALFKNSFCWLSVDSFLPGKHAHKKQTSQNQTNLGLFKKKHQKVTSWNVWHGTLILAFTFLLMSNPAEAKNAIIPTSLERTAHSTGPMPLISFAFSKDSKAKSAKNFVNWRGTGGSPSKVSDLAIVKRYRSHWRLCFNAPARFCKALPELWWVKVRFVAWKTRVFQLKYTWLHMFHSSLFSEKCWLGKNFSVLFPLSLLTDRLVVKLRVYLFPIFSSFDKVQVVK